MPVTNTEEYSSGRRGVTRNLVGQGTGAWVQIPSPPPEKDLVERQGLFQLNPPLRVGEILLCNAKFSLCSSEIAAAVGGFNFTFCVSKIFHPKLVLDFTVR